MSYCSIAQAEALTRVTIPQDVLDAAQAEIHRYTPYRWTSTTETRVLSGTSAGDRFLFLTPPIISVTSLTIDDIALVEETDYEIRHDEGSLRVYEGLPYGHDNITVVYTYGYTSAHRLYADTFPLVKNAEARIALYLYKNPLMLDAVGPSTGYTLQFSDAHLLRLLSPIPKPPEFYVI